ncbi:hypothetical protein RDI58_002803 [Solanum bulbocastanum]|uniref:Uncharacterized protein n=1 Tax=Solanum bulbocastanum TaxID=147425 RepID=A0AAN8YRI1_SOLBU
MIDEDEPILEKAIGTEIEWYPVLEDEEDIDEDAAEELQGLMEHMILDQLSEIRSFLMWFLGSLGKLLKMILLTWKMRMMKMMTRRMMKRTRRMMRMMMKMMKMRRMKMIAVPRKSHHLLLTRGLVEHM